MRNQHWDELSNEQQDHLFYALHDAREAVRERWLMDLKRAMPARVERAIAEQYVQQLKDEASQRVVARAAAGHVGPSSARA